MFSGLVESGSHKKDWKRRGSFLLGTLGLYAVVLAAAGVGSIYAYNARLDEADYEVLALLRFAPPPAAEAPPRREEQRPAAARQSNAPRETTRPEISVHTPYNNRALANAETREVSARERVRIAPQTQDAFEPAAPTGPVGPPGAGFSAGRPGPSTPYVRPEENEQVPEMKRARPELTPQPPPRRPVSMGPLGGKAVSLPKPEYSPMARAIKAQGPVTVQIVVDEKGNVISAQATGGHPALRQLAVQAAYKARFTPTTLGGSPVKVSGFITYNFSLQ